MSDSRKASIVVTLAIGGGLVTPLCGLWFSCGCDWPWNGFFSACNAIMKDAAPPHCPWCVHPLIAAMSIGISLAAGTLAAWRVFPVPANVSAASLYRSGLGVVVVISVLFLGGWLTVIGNTYPSFLGIRLD